MRHRYLLPCIFIPCYLALVQFIIVHVSAGHDDQVILGHGSNLIDGMIKEFMDEKSIAALSLAVTKDDRLVYAQAFGYANSSTNTTATTDSRFRVASVSKTVTAVAIMSLYEQGYLNLTAKVLGDHGILAHDYGSKPYSDAELEISVQHLLEHSSGFIDDDMGGDPTYQQQWLSQTQHKLVGTVLDAFDPSAWPGTNASYSNFGYMVLGRIVEKVTGLAYRQYVQDYILHPVGARNMDIGGDKPKLNEVAYYDANASAPYTFHISRRDSVGAWIARPVDLVAVLTSINGVSQRQDILEASTRQIMYERSTVKDSAYGKGWDAVEHDEHNLLIEANKSGGFPGTTAWVSIRANESITYAVAANKAVSSGADLKNLIDSIMLNVKNWPDIDLFPSYGID